MTTPFRHRFRSTDRLPVAGAFPALVAAALAAICVIARPAAAGELNAASEPLSELARSAIVAAVQNRMRNVSDIAIDDLQVRGNLAGARAIVATFDPGARLGERVRVALKGLRGRSQAVRVGEADCVVRVKTAYFEVIKPVARGEVLDRAVVRRVDDWVSGVLVKPVLEDVTGARAVRALAPGDMVLEHDVVAPPAVRNGETVRLKIVAGSVEVSVEGVAAQDGRVGDDIRIVNPSSGRLLRGRVIGPHAVEVIHGS
jgi:flagella basal body P-ring formation protein FlgA